VEVQDCEPALLGEPENGEAGGSPDSARRIASACICSSASRMRFTRRIEPTTLATIMIPKTRMRISTGA